MVIDTSALVAILEDEPQALWMLHALAKDSKRLLSAATLVEASAVIESRRGEAGGRELDILLHRARVDIVPLDAEQAELARRAYRRFGKGNHPPGLNFGDCFTYALSRSSGEPVLALGDEFSKAGLVVLSVKA